MSDRDAQRAAATALATLLALDLPAASWTLWWHGGLEGHLDLSAAALQAAVTAWADVLAGPVQVARYHNPRPAAAGALAVESSYLGVKIRVWGVLSEADIAALDASAAGDR